MPEQFLILRLSALGDILHTLPSVEALRSAHPDADIRWVVEAPYAELVRCVAPVDEVIEVRTRRWRKSILRRATLGEIRDTVERLSSAGSESVSIDYQGLMKSAIWAALSGVERKLGFGPSLVRERLSLLFTSERLGRSAATHVIDLNLELTSLAAGREAKYAGSDFSRFARDEEGSFTGIVESSPVVLLAGTGREEKVWPAEAFRALACGLRQAGLEVLVMWGPGERESAEAIAEGGAATLAPASTLSQLAFVLRAASLVIGGDTGPLHLADALGTPLLGLYGPTDPRRNGPYQQSDRVVSSFAGSGDMRTIGSSQVLERAIEILRS